MKTFNEFISEARVSSNKLSKAASGSKQEIPDKDKNKINDLLSQLKDYESKPDAKTGKYAKQITSIEKKIDKLSTKYSLTTSDLKKMES